MMKWRKWLICGLCLALILSVSSELCATKKRAGLSLGIGIGGMFLSNPSNSVGDDPNALYPELQIVADLAFIRAGISAGLISREYENIYIIDVYGHYFYGKILDLPVMVDISLLPVRFFAPNSPFQFFIGGSAGILIDSGSTGTMFKEVYSALFCVGPRFGFEFYLRDWAVIEIEGRFIAVPGDTRKNYFNALAGIRFRIPFSKIAK